ncbi:MAG: hypothetical protein ACRD0A_16040 [Acidimicrobiales bacterium]
MDSWTPPPDEPHLFAWWQPLMTFARLARADEVPWLLFADEFRLVRRFDRPGRPSIWVYVHARGSDELMVDESGTAYKFIAYRRGPSPGRFAPIDVFTAVWRAGLPYVIDPEVIDERPRWRYDDVVRPDQVERPDPLPARRTRRRTRRRADHLRLVAPSEP